jgi:hypothetical protein
MIADFGISISDLVLLDFDNDLELTVISVGSITQSAISNPQSAIISNCLNQINHFSLFKILKI